jgi:hypothetical protein
LIYNNNIDFEMPSEILNPDNRPMSEKVSEFFRQLVTTLMFHKFAYQFIREYKPWQGLRQYGWAVKVLIIVAILLGLQFFQFFFEIIRKLSTNPTALQAGLAGTFSGFSFENFSWMLHGGKKYLILIILEIVTYHFVQRTLEIRLGRVPDYSFKTFMKVEKRMIVVSIVSWIAENIIRGLLNIPLGIFGLNFLKQPLGLIIQFFFLGFTMIDSYHDCYGLKVEESRRRTVRVAGVAVAIGGIAYMLMFVPIAGVVAATMLGAVTATMAMEYFRPFTKEEVLAYEAARKLKGRRRRSKELEP